MNQQIKRSIRAVVRRLPMRTGMSPRVAREILQKYSPKPHGTCWTTNEVSIDYDLQIIVPCYNVEKYVQECVDSILKQKTSYRVLVSIVNDGSTDETASILQDILAKANAEKLTSPNRGGYTVELITQENKGLSGARNTALHVIKGMYISFLDSDDVLADGAIQKMLDGAFQQDADILQGSWYTFSDVKTENHIISKEGVLDDNRGVYSGYPWGKLYKFSVMEHFHFPMGFWFEDTPLSFMIAAMPYRFVAIKDIAYGYRFNPKGITATAKRNKRSVESYWITETCLEEFPAFNLSYDQRAYEYLLRQSLQNEGRTRHQPFRIREAEFVLTAELLDRFFEGFKTGIDEMKWIEKALRERRFVRFDLGTMVG
mgnify:CR=1 FL=1